MILELEKGFGGPGPYLATADAPGRQGFGNPTLSPCAIAEEAPAEVNTNQ
jgi:hypothetical protein